MLKSKDSPLAILALIFFVVWLFVFLPIYYGPSPNQTPNKCSKEQSEHHGFWEKVNCDPTAYFTLWLVAFTGVLGISIIGLWWETKSAAERQSTDTKILQRAYISVEPAGIHGWRQDISKCNAAIDICSKGNLPARNVRWRIYHAVSLNDRLNDFRVDIEDAEGENTVPPGTQMRQGGDIIYVGSSELRKQTGLYLYVWGAVWYDDGFGGDVRTTRFCHRYNCVNFEMKGGDGGVMNAIQAVYARFHRYGNDAD